MAQLHRERDGDVGTHLVQTAELSFEVIQDPDAALAAAVDVVRTMLDHVPASQRAVVGAALVRRALS